MHSEVFIADVVVSPMEVRSSFSVVNGNLSTKWFKASTRLIIADVVVTSMKIRSFFFLVDENLSNKWFRACIRSTPANMCL